MNSFNQQYYVQTSAIVVRQLLVSTLSVLKSLVDWERA